MGEASILDTQSWNPEGEMATKVGGMSGRDNAEAVCSKTFFVFNEKALTLENSLLLKILCSILFQLL